MSDEDQQQQTGQQLSDEAMRADLDRTKPPFVPDAEGDAPGPDYFTGDWLAHAHAYQRERGYLRSQQHQPQQQPAHEPKMAAERLAAIRTRWQRAQPEPWQPEDIIKPQAVAAAYQDVPDLLAFAEAALPILRAVASVEPYHPYLNDWEACFFCRGERNMWDAGEFQHAPDCPVTQARALLAGTTETSERAEGANEGSEPG